MRRTRPFSRSGSAARALCLLAVLASWPVSCSTPTMSLPGAPNVILITLDTLRAGHLGCYGYGRPTSGRIDAFSRRATHYANAVSTAPWTVPTHASMFTGKFPFEHGAHSFKVDKPVSNNVNPLPLENLTLAEALKAEGYATGAIVANNVFLKKSFQLDQGFDTYEVRRVRAPEVTQSACRWLQGNRGGRFFLFLNYMDLHRPYNTTPRSGSPLPVPSQDGHLIDELKRQVMGTDQPIPQDLVQAVIDQYDTAVANVDEAVGDLLDRLEKMGLYDDTLIILTSDHGEGFGEHRLVEHSKDLYQQELAVPLIIKKPGQKTGETVDTLVCSVDLPHIVFSHLPAAIRDRYRSRFPYAPGEHPVIAENYYGRLQDLFGVPWAARQNRVRTALFRPPWKYISSTDGHNELYDLAEDPQELNDLSAARHDVVAGMAAQLATFVKSARRFSSRNDERPLSEEELKELKSLGYL